MPYRNSFGDLENQSYRENFVFENGEFLTSAEAKSQLIINYVESLANASNTLFLVHPVPETAINIFKRNSKYWNNNNQILDEIYTDANDYVVRNGFVNESLERLKSENIIHIYPSELLCDEFKCYMQINGVPYYLDDDHLSDIGALLIVEKINETYQ